MVKRDAVLKPETNALPHWDLRTMVRRASLHTDRPGRYVKPNVLSAIRLHLGHG